MTGPECALMGMGVKQGLFSTRRSLVRVLLTGLVSLGGFPMTAVAQQLGPPEQGPTRIELRCAEQPMRHVVFGGENGVTYQEEPARTSEPVRVVVVQVAPDPEAGIEPAHIESDLPELVDDRAIWIEGQQVDSRGGQLRINLRNLVLTLSETGANSETWFRRFACDLVAEEGIAD